LGAFLAGMVVGRSEFSLRAATDALPMRDAFAVLFFVSTGMLFDPRYLFDAPWLVAATLEIVVLGKPLAALGIVLALRYPLRVALAVAVALAQIGEFTFMLAALGRGLGVLPEAATNALVLQQHFVTDLFMSLMPGFRMGFPGDPISLEVVLDQGNSLDLPEFGPRQGALHHLQRQVEAQLGSFFLGAAASG
jgi:predicted Kef-type K+ transport protein